MKKLDAKNRFSLLFIVATFGVALYAALHKDQIIIHWGPFGGHETSGMGYLILLLPLLTVALYLLLRKASNHPFTSMVQFDMPKTGAQRSAFEPIFQHTFALHNGPSALHHHLFGRFCAHDSACGGAFRGLLRLLLHARSA